MFIAFLGKPETPWTPASVSSLWLDGGDSSSVTQIAGKVSQWDDKSGNLNHAVQLTDDSKPVYSNDYLAFDGVDDFLSIPSSSKLVATNKLTIVTKFNVDATAVSGFIVAKNETSTGDIEYGIRFSSSTNKLQLYINGVSTYNTNTVFTKGVDYVVSFVWDGAKVYCYVNGVYETNANYSTSISLTDGSLNIGKSINASAALFKGLIKDIVVANTNLSDTDRQKIEQLMGV